MTNEYTEPTLRQLLDDSAEAAKGPGRYCDRMAYVIDIACDPNGDETVSAGLGGLYATRFGRRVLLINDQGFCSSQAFKTPGEAAAAMQVCRAMYEGPGEEE